MVGMSWQFVRDDSTARWKVCQVPLWETSRAICEGSVLDGKRLLVDVVRRGYLADGHGRDLVVQLIDLQLL